MTNQIQIPYNFTPRDYQLGFFIAFDNGIRKFFLVWPRQVGKDTVCWALMVREAVRVPGNYFYIFPTATDAKRALWEKVLDDGSKLLHMLPINSSVKIAGRKLVKRMSNVEMVIELFNNSTIRIVGLDKNVHSIRGITPQGVVFSEFAFSQFDAYKNVVPALHSARKRSDKTWQVINSTPNGDNHFFSMYEGIKDDKSWWVSRYQSLYSDKEGFIYTHPQEYFEDLVKTGVSTWDDIEREYGCSFAVGLKGSFYNDLIELATKEGRIGNYLYNSDYPVYTGWDVGVDDQTVVWFYQLIGNAVIFIDYYAWDKPLGAAGYVSYLASRNYKYDDHDLPHDSANRRTDRYGVTSTLDLFEEAAQNIPGITGSFNALDKPSHKQHAIDLVRSQFPMYCFDLAKCKRGIDYLRRYHRKYDKARRTYIKEPHHDDSSHTADALQSCAIAISGRTLDLCYTEELEGLVDFDVFSS